MAERLRRPAGRAVRRLLPSVALAALSLVMCLAAFEGGARLFSRGRRLGVPTGQRAIWCYDATKGWFHRPGSSSHLDDGAGWVHINSLGLRGPEPHRDDSAAPVLVLGDSFVFGVRVPERDLATTRLAAQLDTEVVNAGVAGYSTDQELILMGELLPRLHPRLVILVVCDNDLDGNVTDFLYYQYYKPYFTNAADGALTLHNSPVPRLSRAQRAKLMLARHSELWAFVASRSPTGALAGIVRWSQVATPLRLPGRFRITDALIGRMAHMAAVEGSRFLVTTTGRRGEDVLALAKLGRMLGRRGVRFVDLYPELEAARRAQPGRSWDFPGDRHWGSAAHALVAERLARLVEERPDIR